MRAVQGAIDEHFLADAVPAHLMDRLWAAGWRHFGTHFFRYSGRDGLHVLPLRLRLGDWQPSQSQKRILKRNASLELRVRAASINDEKRRLFALHSRRFKENVPDQLEDFLGPTPAQVCETIELCLYKDGILVGAHFLDLGQQASSCVYSIYDPGHSQHSLGICLILHALLLSRELGKRHCYPGYAYVEPSAYDYKKRLGSLEVFDWHGWRASDFKPEAIAGAGPHFPAQP